MTQTFLGRFLLAGSLLMAWACQVVAFDGPDDNWPNWRGPNDNGVAANSAKPPVEWSPTTNVKWKVPVAGKGISTPIVWENQIILTTAVADSSAGNNGQADVPAEGRQDAQDQSRQRREGQGEGQGRGGQRQRGGGGGGGRGGGAPVTAMKFLVVSLDRTTGNKIWETIVHEGTPHEGVHGTNTFASASPITDGERIYASFGSNGIYCLDMQGKVIWKKDLGNMTMRGTFGEGASPALHGDTLVVPWDHEGASFLVALDATSGAEKWKVDRDERSTWSTPLITEYNGTTQVITNGSTRVRSYNLADGSLIWECTGQVMNPVPTPIRDGDYVVVMTGYQGFAIQSIALDSKGDVSGTDKIRWSRRDSAPYVPTGVLYGDRLYITKSRDAIISILNAETGEEYVDQERLPGLDGLYASLGAANGHIYVFGRNGNAVVLKHGDKLEIVAQNRLDEGVDASPVMLGNQLFVRTHGHMYCFE